MNRAETSSWGARFDDTPYDPETPELRGCGSCNAVVEGHCDGCGDYFCGDCLTRTSPYVELCSDCIRGAR